MIPTLIEVKQERTGFDRFIGTWVCEGEQNLVVDVGPANSVMGLIESLEEMNVDRIDYVLITHIHIDHAGGLADFLEHFPMAKAICYEKAVGHLVEPSKLWAGSQHVLGELAQVYGRVKPVKQERLIPHTQADVRDLEIVETPGHAPHHISFRYQDSLFVGEAAGNYFSMGNADYIRPATPPVFLLQKCLMSVDLLLAAEDQPICYAHFGQADSSHQMLVRFREQLLKWEEIISEEMSRGHDQLVERCTESLFEKDPNLKNFESLEPEIQEREKFLMVNSINGFIGYLEN